MLVSTYPTNIVPLTKCLLENRRQVLFWCLRCQCSANGGKSLVSDKLQCKDSEREAEEKRRWNISAEAIWKPHAASKVVFWAFLKARTYFPRAFCRACCLIVWNGRRLSSILPSSSCAWHRCQLDIFTVAVMLGTPLEWTCCVNLIIWPHLPRALRSPRSVGKCVFYFNTFQMRIEKIQLEGFASETWKVKRTCAVHTESFP